MCHIRHYISEDTAQTTACSMLDGRLDYCNALLCGTSSANIHILQRVQNSMTRAVIYSRRSEHNTKHVLANRISSTLQTRCLYVQSANNTRTELSVWIDPVSYPSLPTFDPAAAIGYSKIGANLHSLKLPFVTQHLQSGTVHHNPF